MFESYLIYLNTVLRSKYIREQYIKKIGFEEAVRKFNSMSGKPVHEALSIQGVMYKKLKSGEPFFAGRLGSNELLLTAKCELEIHHKMKKSMDVLCTNAGFFPNDMNLANEYAQLMIKSMRNNDVLGVSYIPFEDYAIKNWFPSTTELTEIRCLEPWFSEKPWTLALEGKKVLVIHPFSEEIQSQYAHKDKLFDREILPDFDLLIQKAIQTIAGTKDSRFSTWFDALDYMTEEALNKNFDVALIGCGAYGFPLASRIKEAGKQAVHMGGVLQAMFGIKGKRWDVDMNPTVRNFYNEYWIRPGVTNTPQNNNSVEQGCYW